MHFESDVGHIGGNMSCMDALLLVQHEYLSEQDRFVLSKGHSAGALHIALWSLGRLSDEAIRQFHKDDTLLAGHPPASGIADIRYATGSLGHGLSLAAGTAKRSRSSSSPGMFLFDLGGRMARRVYLGSPRVCGPSPAGQSYRSGESQWSSGFWPNRQCGVHVAPKRENCWLQCRYPTRRWS